MKRPLTILTAIVTLFLSQLVLAKQLKEADFGLAINTSVPALTALDVEGKPVHLEQLSGEKGLILIFFRSADWCPFCKKHLKEIDQGVEKLISLGYGVAGISYDSREILQKFSTEAGLKYPLIADQNNQSMKDFGVLNTHYKPGSKHYGIPYPGVMVINKEGKLVYKYFYEGYKQRVMVGTLIRALSK